jgi:hypothetical protein
VFNVLIGGLKSFSAPDCGGSEAGQYPHQAELVAEVGGDAAHINPYHDSHPKNISYYSRNSGL